MISITTITTVIGGMKKTGKSSPAAGTDVISFTLLRVREDFQIKFSKNFGNFPDFGGGGVKGRSFSRLFQNCLEWANSSRNAKNFFFIFVTPPTIIANILLIVYIFV